MFTIYSLTFTILTMTFYPPKISENFHAPQNAGRAAGANAVGTSATFTCGAVLRFTLQIDNKTKQIIKVGFQTSGCGYAIAAADILAEKITGKHLPELHGLDKTALQREIKADLSRFEENREHCLTLALETLQSVFADFRAAQIEEWTGEKALICTCFGVSEETIERVIKNESLETVEEVTLFCKAGDGCGSCQPLIQEILDDARREF